MDEKRKLIGKTLLDLARFYAYDIGEKQFHMYVDVLMNFSVEEFSDAVKMYLIDSNNTKFPIPPHSIIIKTTRNGPSDDDFANEVAARVHQAVSKFGYPSPEKAKAFIGEVGWDVVRSYGGWEYICENLGVDIQISAFRAQVRDAARSKLSMDKMGVRNQPVNFRNDRIESLQQDKVSIEKLNNVIHLAHKKDGI
jgi:hypothetical protein